jgi:hypothetical protein
MTDDIDDDIEDLLEAVYKTTNYQQSIQAVASSSQSNAQVILLFRILLIIIMADLIRLSFSLNV